MGTWVLRPSLYARLAVVGSHGTCSLSGVRHRTARIARFVERSTNGTASFAVPIDLGRSDRSEPVDFIWAYVGPTNLNFDWDSRGKARVKVVVPSEATR